MTANSRPTTTTDSSAKWNWQITLWQRQTVWEDQVPAILPQKCKLSCNNVHYQLLFVTNNIGNSTLCINGSCSLYPKWRVCILWLKQCQKWGQIFTGLMRKLYLRFTIISDVYRSFMPNKTAYTKDCLTQWISKLLGSFEIHWGRRYLVNFTGLAGIVNATVYQSKQIFSGHGHSKLS